MAIGAFAPQLAVAMPVSAAALSLVTTQSTPTGIALFPAQPHAGAARGAVALRVFGFGQSGDELLSSPAHTPLGVGLTPLNLTLDRIFDSPFASLGGSAAATGSLVTDAVFGVEATATGGPDQDATPVAFAAIVSTSVPSVALSTPFAYRSTVAAVGLKFKLLGGEHTIAFEDVTSRDGLGVSARSRSPFSLDAIASAPGNPAFGADRTFQKLALGLPDSGSLLDIGSENFVTLPAFAPSANSAAGLSYPAAYTSNARGASVQLNLPLTLGNVDARLSLSGRELHDLRPSLSPSNVFGTTVTSGLGGRYEEFRGGVTIGVPVFRRKAEVSLNGVIDRLVRDDRSPNAFGAQPPLSLSPFAPATVSGLNGSNPTLTLDPNYINLRRYVGAYSVAVPISTALTANMQYVDQRYGGDSVNSLVQDIRVGTTLATFGVFYKIPNTNASINLNFNQYKFENDLSPANNWVHNRQNLYFSVKF